MNINFLATASLAHLASTRCSPPVISDVSPNNKVLLFSYNLSNALPTVGFEPKPEVVSDSPHLVDTHNSLISQGSRCNPVA